MRRLWFSLGAATYAFRQAWRVHPFWVAVARGTEIPEVEFLERGRGQTAPGSGECGCPDCVASRLRVPPEARPN